MRGVDFFIFPHWSMVHYGKIISQRFGHCKLSVQRGPSISPKWHSLLSSKHDAQAIRLILCLMNHPMCLPISNIAHRFGLATARPPSQTLHTISASLTVGHTSSVALGPVS